MELWIHDKKLPSTFKCATFRLDFTTERRIAVFPAFKGKSEYCLKVWWEFDLTEPSRVIPVVMFYILVAIIMTSTMFIYQGRSRGDS